MEAESYLTSGFGIRVSIESQKCGWVPLKALARVWQPSRLKGTLVSPEFGTPFLAATQVFDLRPVPRKWLALERTQQAANRFVHSGSILVSCSGSVGRATLAHTSHQNVLISHDLLRVDPINQEWWGWIYAYLRSSHARQIMISAHYGHIIKHLEISHLNALPLPVVSRDLRCSFNDRVRKILEHREQAHVFSIEAEGMYGADIGTSSDATSAETGFPACSSSMRDGRHRLEAAFHHPGARNIIKRLQSSAKNIVPLSMLVKEILVPGRFKHIYGDAGVPYLDSADILEVSPQLTKLVLSLDERKQQKYKVQAGALLMPCSGQVYGNLGSVVLATEWHEEKILSNHIMRIIPRKSSNIRSGCLACVLGHASLGRPLLLRLAFGSSVPELSPQDVATVPIPRLAESLEHNIAECMNQAANLRTQADTLEMELAAEAEQIISRFMAGERSERDSSLEPLSADLPKN